MGVKKAIKKWEPSNDLVERVYKYVRDGMRTDEIKAMMLLEMDYTDEQWEQIVEKTYQVAELSIMKDREYAFQLHMNRYEALYEEAMRLHDAKGIPLVMPKDFAYIRARYVSALMALKNKEDLIGLHDKQMVLEFNDQKAVVIDKHDGRGNAAVGFDFERLSLDELKELLELIKSCRSVPLEGVERVVIKQTKIEINMTTGDRTSTLITKNIDNVEHVKDITFEEMPEKVIDRVEDITPIEEEPVKPKELIEDLTGGLKEKSRSGSDLLEELRNKLGKLS